MTPIEAEKIINEYWRSMKDLRSAKAIVQPISDLPCSTGMIKYAHFVYGEELIKKNLLTKKIGDQLTQSYSKIHSRFVEDSDHINTKYKEYITGLEKGKIVNDFKLGDLIDIDVEYNNFLADCQGNYGRNKD